MVAQLYKIVTRFVKRPEYSQIRHISAQTYIHFILLIPSQTPNLPKPNNPYTSNIKLNLNLLIKNLRISLKHQKPHKCLQPR